MLTIGTPSLAFAVTLALGADVVAKHGSKDEVLFRSQLIQRTVDEKTDGIEALLAAEIHIDTLYADATVT